MMRPLPRGARARRGAAAVEFALALSLGLLPVIFGIIDWSWYFFQQTTVQQALISSARVAAQIDMPSSCPDTVFIDEFEERLDELNLSSVSDEITVTIDSFDYGPTSETVYQINASYSAQFAPFLGLIPTPEKLSVSFVLPLEDQSDAPDCAS